MPQYDYLCVGCGPFKEQRPMAGYSQPTPCPSCGGLAPRAITSTAVATGMDPGGVTRSR